VSLIGTAIEPVERLVRAPLLLLDGGVVLRIDRLTDRRDGGGEGDGLLELVVELLERRAVAAQVSVREDDLCLCAGGDRVGRREIARPDRRERPTGAGELGGRVARREGHVELALAPRRGQRDEARLGRHVAPQVWLLGTVGRERVADGLLHRLNRLAARRDGGGGGDGLLQLQLDVELLGQHGLLVGHHLDHGCVPLRLAKRVRVWVFTFEPLRFGRVFVEALAEARVALLLHSERRLVWWDYPIRTSMIMRPPAGRWPCHRSCWRTRC